MPIRRFPRGAGSRPLPVDPSPVNLNTSGFHRISHITSRKPAMIESLADIAELDYPGPDTTIADADLADWIEQQQTLPLADDDYPHEVHHEPR
jgi:hypothetical protein